MVLFVLCAELGFNDMAFRAQDVGGIVESALQSPSFRKCKLVIATGRGPQPNIPFYSHL